MVSYQNNNEIWENIINYIQETAAENPIERGKCDNCFNFSVLICDECKMVEHCQSCFEHFKTRSEIYNNFMEHIYDNFENDGRDYMCIYCFIDLQHEEIKPETKTKNDEHDVLER